MVRGKQSVFNGRRRRYIFLLDGNQDLSVYHQLVVAQKTGGRRKKWSYIFFLSGGGLFFIFYNTW